MNKNYIRDSILRVGEVSGIEGRKVFISVDKNKNVSDLFFNGEVIKNVSVGSYIEIRKGFLSLIGKADGEKLSEEKFFKPDDNRYQELDKNRRFLTISLVGYIGLDGRFIGGIKELPLIGNEAFIVTESKINKIHNLLKKGSSLHINIAKTDIEEIPVELPIDNIFNSHIAIFGNTGSGKSNTLAALYQELFTTLSELDNFNENCKFLLFDFNGEYTREYCISPNKTVYNLSTRVDDEENKIPMTIDELLDIEALSILVEATEKTQKPFLKRALRFYKNSLDKDKYASYLRVILQNKIKQTLKMAHKDTAFKLLDYLEEIFKYFVTDEELKEIRNDIEFHNQSLGFFKKGTSTFFSTNTDAIEDTSLFEACDEVDQDSLAELSDLDEFYIFLHLQLIEDVYRYKVQIDHIYPVINRFRSKKQSIERTFHVNDDNETFWKEKNLVVINLRDVNLDMRKTIPLLLSKNIYNTHKKEKNQKSLNIIIDEAHNILSKASFRETEEWKDYRLETFEEIIKEGRKFGVFVTIASQRPNDISETIISQAHNYFIHQLINHRDLLTISNAVSYIDKITEESIPTLSVGTCIFSGIATPMPLKIKISELSDNQKPDSHTLKFEAIAT
jgi:hypothetical protein